MVYARRPGPIKAGGHSGIEVASTLPDAPYPLCSGVLFALRRAQGNCCVRVLFGVVLPTFTRMGSRSLLLPVYFT